MWGPTDTDVQVRGTRFRFRGWQVAMIGTRCCSIRGKEISEHATCPIRVRAAGSVRGTVVIRGWESDAMIRVSRRGAWWLLIGGKGNIAAGRDACEGILGI
ncbi:hypothetical protein Tco_0505054 [Tanacetum coccineum]